MGASRDARRRFAALVAAALLVGLAAIGIARHPPAFLTALGRRPEPRYVGRAACAPCHATEMRRFAGSRHDLAMQPADSSTVLGDFASATFEHFGVTTTFHREGGRYRVTTDGPDGAPADYEVAYTFGVYPLQQYLIPLPGGRYQALSVAWDSRARSEGGQRWFHLYPDEPIPARDVLHWTGPAQNWNYMCAECHSTNLRKGWNATTREYRTTSSEIDVSCEACHGPGSAHVEWARREARRRGWGAGPGADSLARRSLSMKRLTSARMGLVGDLQEPPAAWIPDSTTGIAHRERPRASHAEVEMCARCHARRTQLFEDAVPGRPLMATHRPALLEPLLYHADGQQLEEVYEYGSFIQSWMYAAGVTCGDCHDPHSGRLVVAPDSACARCHLPAKFATREHHHHKPGTKGASCVECHMTAKAYMVVDPRRDHSFRVPRPDLNEKLGVPDACSGCHRDRPVSWSSRAVRAWYPGGRWTRPHYGEAIAAGRRDDPRARPALVALAGDRGAPGIVRATAISMLAEGLAEASLPTVERALSDPDPLVRAAALDPLAGVPPADRVRLGAPLLSDPVRGVRIEAAGALAGDAQIVPADRRAAFDAAVAEFRAAQATNADRPESYVNLGALEVRLGDRAAARRAYEEGLTVGPWLAALWANLADLLREEGDDAGGERVLRRGLGAAADSAALHHALGLNLVRQRRVPEALSELRRAAELAPGEARYAYVFGVALNSEGRPAEAIAVLEGALRRHPADRDVLTALVAIHRDRGQIREANAYVRRLEAIR